MLLMLVLLSIIVIIIIIIIVMIIITIIMMMMMIIISSRARAGERPGPRQPPGEAATQATKVSHKTWSSWVMGGNHNTFSNCHDKT